MTRANLYSKGAHYEDLALDYLLAQGLCLVERNFNCRMGELDIVMRDQEYLVIVEVRYRKNRLYGGASASINRNKQDKLRRTAMYYLQQRKINLYTNSWRFDVVSIENDGRSIQWIPNAFC